MAQNGEPEPVFAGIYRNYDDYRAGILSYSVDCSKEKQKIRLHDHMQRSYIDVIYRGEKERLDKSVLFGYQDCQGNVFRFYCNQQYQQAEIRAISIYFTEEDILYGSYFIRERLFYFCSDPDGPLLPLTIGNLKAAFPENQKFHDLLDEEVKHDSYAGCFDPVRGIFLVNELYQRSLKCIPVE